MLVKSSKELKEQIEFWFLSSLRKTKEEVNREEQFTLFDLIEKSRKEQIEGVIELRNFELPVLILDTGNGKYIVNTTERFIRIENSKVETIDYQEFECHKGFKSLIINDKGKRKSIKEDGTIAEFGISKRNGEIVYWKIPTGSTGFSFWNVTNKCELIGRKYQI